MATDIIAPLTEAWVEVATGPVLIVLVSGTVFWAFNGLVAPTSDDDYIPISTKADEPFYSYKGTEKTFVKNGSPVSSTSNVLVSVTPIV